MTIRDKDDDSTRFDGEIFWPVMLAILLSPILLPAGKITDFFKRKSSSKKNTKQ